MLYRTRKRKRNTEKPKKKVSSDSGAEINSDISSDNADSDASDVEEKYEKDMADRPVKKLKPLLPIKTKEGIMERNEEVEGMMIINYISAMAETYLYFSLLWTNVQRYLLHRVSKFIIKYGKYTLFDWISNRMSVLVSICAMINTQLDN